MDMHIPNILFAALTVMLIGNGVSALDHVESLLGDGAPVHCKRVAKADPISISNIDVEERGCAMPIVIGFCPVDSNNAGTWHDTPKERLYATWVDFQRFRPRFAECLFRQDKAGPLVVGLDPIDQLKPQSFDFCFIMVRKLLEQKNVCKHVNRQTPADVGDLQFHAKREAVSRCQKTIGNFQLTRKPRSIFHIPDLSCIDCHSLSGSQSFSCKANSTPHEENANSSKQKSQERGDGHAQGPDRHILLGFQVFVGTLFFLVGCYLFFNTLDRGVKRSSYEAIGNAGFAFGIILCGYALAVSGIFIML
jgi:hypothetical protein